MILTELFYRQDDDFPDTDDLPTVGTMRMNNDIGLFRNASNENHIHSLETFLNSPISLFMFIVPAAAKSSVSGK